MNVQSLSFLLFLAAVLAVCLPLGRRSLPAGKACLTAACIAGYLLGGGVRSFAVLGVGLAVTWAALGHLRPDRAAAERRRWAVLAAGWHIAVLLGFKYTGFLTGGAVAVRWAPVGLSFFTFQQLWLLREAWVSGFCPAGAGDLLLSGFFFPTVTSGPILKPENVFPQLDGSTFLRPTWQDAAAGGYALALGTAKKVLLADSFGVVVNNGWAAPEALSAPAAWLVILGYTFQLYFDFSGYCDVAAGCARLLGIRLPLNFDSPYRSFSLGEFWRRWHMTLTGFLRECVYIPLGGSRRGTARTYANILTIYLISGLWHGAGWTFIVWGLLHGLGQVAERAWGTRRERLPGWLRWGLTFLFVNVAWVFFRAPDLGEAAALLSAAVSGPMALPEPWLLSGLLDRETAALGLLVPALGNGVDGLRLALLYGAGALAAFWPRNTVRQMDAFRPTVWRGVLCAGLLAWSILSFSGVTTFIYSNF